MPDAETNALRRAKTLRENINSRTGYNDETVTRGVQRLLDSSGSEVLMPHEAQMHLDIYPDPVISKEEFARMMDYQDEIDVDEIYYELKQLEYIIDDGYGYIDTGLLSNDFDEVNIDCELSTVSIGSSFYGGSSSTTAASVNTKTVIFVENNSRFWTNMGFSNQWVGESVKYKPQANVRYNVNTIMRSGLQRMSVDGVEKIRGTYTGTTNSAYHVWFLNLNYAGTSYIGTGANQQRGFNGKIYSSEWLLNSVQVRNFVPYVKEYRRRSDDSLFYEEAGFKDTLTNTFYKSIGSPFTKGPYIT